MWRGWDGHRGKGKTLVPSLTMESRSRDVRTRGRVQSTLPPAYARHDAAAPVQNRLDSTVLTNVGIIPGVSVVVVMVLNLIALPAGALVGAMLR